MLALSGLAFIPDFFPGHRALFDRLMSEVQWDERIRSRKTASFGVSYDYSGMAYPETAMPDFIDAVAKRIHTEPASGFLPNNCLLNYYPDGQSSMGFHSDSSEELADGTGVAIVSLGGEREIRFRHKQDRSDELSFQLLPGSLLCMSKALQAHWLHAIPKSEFAAPRVSMTFRRIIKNG